MPNTRTEHTPEAVGPAELDSLAHTLANVRQGRSSTPRCEPPSAWDIQRALSDIRDVLALPAIHAEYRRQSDRFLANSLTEAAKPWADFNGELPDYDHPLRCVYESGIQYAVNLLAKVLNVEDYDVCDGTEEFDGDLGGTMFNIVLSAMPKDEHGDPMHPSDLRAASPAKATEARRVETGTGSVHDGAVPKAFAQNIPGDPA